MGRRDLVVVLGVAAATAALILTVCRPALVSAEDEEAGKKRLISRPSLRVDGVTVTLESAKEEYRAGEKPTVKLIAINTAPEPRAVNLTLRMMATAPTSLESRMLPLPKEAWRHTCPISLKAGEAREIPISVDVALPPGNGVFFTMNPEQPSSGSLSAAAQTSAGARPSAGNKSTAANMFAIPYQDRYLTIKTTGGPAKTGSVIDLQSVNIQSSVTIFQIVASGGK